MLTADTTLGRPRLIDVRNEWRLSHQVRAYRRATVVQIDNTDDQRDILQDKVY